MLEESNKSAATLVVARFHYSPKYQTFLILLVDEKTINLLGGWVPKIEGFGNFLPEGASRTLAQAEELVFQKRLGLLVLGLGAPKLRLAFEDVEGFLWKATEALKTENFPPRLGFMFPMMF